MLDWCFQFITEHVENHQKVETGAVQKLGQVGTIPTS